MNYYIAALKKYAEFDGRSRRSEYWYFQLVNFIISAVLSGGGYVTDITEIGSVYSLAVLVPSIAVSVRRLHDVGKSGWNYLWIFFPVVGWIILLVYHVRDGELGENQYGVNPKEEQEDFQLYE